MSGATDLAQAASMASVAAEGAAPALRLQTGVGSEWAWLLALAAVDLLWCWWIGMTISQLRMPLLIAGGLALMSVTYRHAGRSRRIADACEIAAIWIGLSIAGCVLTYLCATWSLPPRDALFDRLDLWLGFDWRGWNGAVRAHPLPHWVLATAYASFMPQLLLAILYFAFTDRHARNRALFRAALIALVITAVVSGLAPALSAFSFYGLPERAPYLHDLLVLRAGGAMASAAPLLQGIITLPSYHAVLAVLVAWGFRRTGRLGVAIAGWNLVMLVSIPSEGGHYLVDVIAGVAVAGAALWLARTSLPALSGPDGVRRP